MEIFKESFQDDNVTSSIDVASLFLYLLKKYILRMSEVKK